MGKTCQMCGTDNGDKQKFCSACGKPLDGAPAPAGKATSTTDSKAKTMIIGGAAGAPAAKKPSSQAAGLRSGERTMLGLPAVNADSVKQKEAPKPGRDIPIAKISSSAPRGPQHMGGARTMLGMAVPAQPASPSNKSKGGAAPAHQSTGSRTVLGMPAAGLVERAESPGEGAASAAGDSDVGSVQAPTEAMATFGADEEGSLKLAKTAPAGDPFTDDDVVDGAPDYDDSSGEWPAEEDEEPRSNALVVAVVAAGIVAFLVVGALLYLLLFDTVPAIKPQIFPSPDGKSLVVALSLPNAPPGTTVQVAGQTAGVAQGTAKATLPLTAMKLGLNDIPLIYTEPGSSPERLTFPVVLRHTIEDDLSGLSSPKPFVTVVFQIAPDIRLKVAGESVNVVNNTYVHKVMVDALPPTDDAAPTRMHAIPFQLIDASGAVEQGEHVVPIPVASLQIDRPAPDAQIVSDLVTCAGKSDPGAKVAVNGRAVASESGGFSTTVPLPALGEHIISVTASVPGKAPRSERVKVTRIESLAPVLEAWSVDLDRELDYPTIGRNPESHIGKKVKLNGRVVNINTVKGVTAFILYVGQGCPAKSKCAVYVVFKGETEAGLQSWVDVYGMVRGTHAVDMQNGIKIEVPAIDADYVVKSDPKPERRRK